MHGASMRTLDDRERDAFLAYTTALSGGFGKDNKPLIKSPKDLFDRAKAESEMERNIGGGKSRVKEETVAKFKASKEHAEAILNRRRTNINEGEEDINGE